MMQAKCIFCGADVALVHVHGHYQCPACKTNALPCCDGDTCSNFLLAGEQGIHHVGINSAATEVKNTCTKSSGGYVKSIF